MVNITFWHCIYKAVVTWEVPGVTFEDYYGEIVCKFSHDGQTCRVEVKHLKSIEAVPING